MLGKSPKKGITLSLKAKARRNDLRRPLPLTELENCGETLTVIISSSVLVFGIDSLPFSDFFEVTKCNRTRTNHDYQLYVKVAIINCYKYSFIVRIVNAWNNLPKYVVHARSLTLFRNRLRIYMNID